MKILRFHRNNALEQLLPFISQGFFWIIGLGLIPQEMTAQSCEIFSGGVTPYCEKVTVGLFGNDTWSTHHWDFGDGTPIIVGGPNLNQVSHDYHGDINPYTTPFPVARHSQDGTNWCEIELRQILPFILIGSGCGSQKIVSNLVVNHKLPATELIGKTLFIYGNLEVDIPYKFDGCTILILSGGKITVKAGGALTLTNNTMLDAIYDSNDANCQSLWSGIEVLSGGTLTTNGASIRNAYFGIRLVNPGNASPLPKLSIQNTIFQRNFIGIYAAEGSFALSIFRNNTFLGVGNNAIYPISTCNPSIPVIGVSYAQRTYCGIYFDGSMGGSLLMGASAFNNLFKDLQAGIVCLNGTSTLQGCRFENIAYLSNITASNQGTAITFIDNLGGKILRLTGLGNNGIATINNCERGVYAQTSKLATQVFVSDCRMVEVQNGVELDESGAGNFLKGIVSNCYIGCTKWLPNIKEWTTGIEIKDPNIAYSSFIVKDNKIDVDQPEGYTPNGGVELNILPRGISIVGMHSAASNNAMALNVSNNIIDLIKGPQGIVLTNVANGSILNNQVYHDLNTIDPNAPLAGIYVLGGVSNTLLCNSVYQTNQDGSLLVGLACEGSPRMIMSQNSAENGLSGISFVGQNQTDCIVSYNNLSFNLVIPGLNSTGIFYSNAQTGPQYYIDPFPNVVDEKGYGNDWFGNFQYGAWFLGGAFPYCTSIYHVSPDANVANSTNPVDQGVMQNCSLGSDTWFTVLEVPEDDYSCGGTTGGSVTLSKNEADLHLAGGGTLSLSTGYRWSSEMGLYRKFTENPGLAIGDPVINTFLQAQQGQIMTAMYALQNSVNGIEGSIPFALRSNIQNTLEQLATNNANLLILLENEGTNPNAMASYAILSTQTQTLEQSLQGYLTSASNSMALSAVVLSNTNNNISCSSLPCTAERYINGLYLQTQFITPRALTGSELDAIRLIALNCPNEAGNIVYLARAWYYLKTGVILDNQCGSFAPPIGPIERGNQPELTEKDEMVLIPNPANGSVQVTFQGLPKESTIFISDVWGRILINRKVSEVERNNAIVIPTEDFANGLYLVSIKTNDGKPVTKKLIIAH